MAIQRHQCARVTLLVGLLLAVCSGAAGSVRAAEDPTEGEKLFALQVQPIFREKCAGCHAEDPDALEGGFDIRSRESLLAGGDAFGDAVLIPGDAKTSHLRAVVAREEAGYAMPPKEADRLSDKEVWAIRDWINAGAPWPDDERVAEIYRQHAAGVRVETSGGLSEVWTNRKYKPEDLWAFQPLRRPSAAVAEGEPGNPVDSFIDRRMDELGVSPAPLADRWTLIRRATFDLLGLPPTPEEIERFVKDPRDDDAAYASLLDRLLASPQYGEQWARHWLDVVRYADSSGYANDYERPNAWRYRDYVVRAFNEDKPFDRFVREQLAGDELIAAAQERGEPLAADEQTELLIAAGFLRMGPWEHTGMSVARVTRQLFLDDITDTVGQVFLGQALQCCRCHDHKFDPIPTRDFYSMQAVFATTQFAEVETTWLPEENRSGMPSDRHYHELRHDSNERMLAELEQRQREYEAQWFQQRGLPYKSKAEAKRAGADEDDIPVRTLMTPDEFGRERIGRKWQTRFEWEFDRYEPIALTVYDGKTLSPKNIQSRLQRPEDPLAQGVLEKTAILAGGDPFSPTEAVQPGVLSAVPGGRETTLPAGVSGRRLALAEWIVSPENTLTSRVLANRVWAFHFGRGIAGNPNNFGATGKKPTHPELLDWLAVELMRSGWSVKHLHRIIMTSQAYRRSTSHPHPGQLADLDPARSSYAVFLPRRLEAEEIRDAMLSASGELIPEIGGIPVRPDMNLEAALQPRMIMGTFAPSYVPGPLPEQRNRRSIYVQKLRGHLLPFMEIFNQPGSATSCELRDQSNITPQVFAMLNGQETNDRALALSVRVLHETQNDRAAIARAYRLIFGRQAQRWEIDAALDHWGRMRQTHATARIEPASFPTDVVREANDENTGRPFAFAEKLFAYEDYVPDLQPHEVDGKTRALADVCLVLLNANEFVYVY